jgi:hypothetical protein
MKRFFLVARSQDEKIMKKLDEFYYIRASVKPVNGGGTAVSSIQKAGRVRNRIVWQTYRAKKVIFRKKSFSEKRHHL